MRTADALARRIASGMVRPVDAVADTSPTLLIQPNRTAESFDPALLTSNPQAFDAQALRDSAVELLKLRSGLRFEIGPRKGTLLPPSLRKAADLVSAGDSVGALTALTSAASLPASLFNLHSFALFLDDLLPAARGLERGRLIVIRKAEFRALGLAGESYGAPGAEAVRLDTVAPVESAKSAASPKKSGIAMGLKSGRISRSFNPRQSERARESSARAQALAHFENLIKIIPKPQPKGNAAEQVAILVNQPSFIELVHERQRGELLSELSERQVRDYLWISLSRRHPKASDGVLCQAINVTLQAMQKVRKTPLGQSAEGAPAEALEAARNHLVETLTEVVGRDSSLAESRLAAATLDVPAWRAFLVNPDLLACWALMTSDEVRDTARNAVERLFGEQLARKPSRVLADHIQVRIAAGLQSGVLAHIQHEGRERTLDAVEAFEEVLEDPRAIEGLGARLAEFSASDSGLAKLMAHAFGCSDTFEASSMRKGLVPLLDGLRRQAEWFGEASPDDLQTELCGFPFVLDRTRRATDAHPDSFLATALEGFLHQEPPGPRTDSFITLADAMAACAALRLGPFRALPLDANGPGVWAAIATRAPVLTERHFQAKLARL